MKRFNIAPRADWQSKVEKDGLIWHTAKGVPYWNESAYYSFTSDQIQEIKEATENCHQMFVTAGQHIIDKNRFAEFGIHPKIVPLITEAWEDEPPCLNYGRFDFGYDGINPPKLFEYNCDTPTSLVEASVIQWSWFEEVFPYLDQFNDIHNTLVSKWKHIKPHLPEHVHFTHVDESSGEDAINTAYMMDTAYQAGIDVIPILINQIGLEDYRMRFIDEDGHEIEALYKLYPWEWLVKEQYSKAIGKNSTLFLEPIWKMIWSNKAILPILWELYPNHKNLLEASFEPNEARPGWVRKPILGREGANVEIWHKDRSFTSTKGSYGDEGYVYQELYNLPNYSGKYPVIGSWSVDGESCGIGIREDGLITGNTANFVPHVIEG
jgi:glutathionylspermidine synthase